LADQDVAYRIASLYALDKDADRALEWLERAILMGNENYPWFLIDPKWAGLRDNARYQEMMKALKGRWEELHRRA
jgi:eukaryotic-like serine/threonine-protein kinase